MKLKRNDNEYNKWNENNENDRDNNNNKWNEQRTILENQEQKQ